MKTAIYGARPQGGVAGSLRMSNQLGYLIGIAVDPEVEPPIVVDSGLPASLCLVVFLGMERRMPQISNEEAGIGFFFAPAIHTAMRHAAPEARSVS